MNKINIDYFDLSGIGRRSNNEDKSLCAVKGSSDSDNRVIIAVADGMGGLEAGQVASQRVYDLLVRFYQEGLPVDFQQAAGKVSSIIKSANRDIYELSQKKGGIQMGTTVSGAVIVGNRCLVFNVGDSRTYLIRGAAMKQVSEDHSIDRESVKAGAIKEEDIGKGLYSNALTRSVGTDPEVEIDIFPKNHFFEMERGDILFSCTDGLWNKVTDADILKVFNRNRNIKKALEILYDLAFRNGSKDNISMAAYRYEGQGKGPGKETNKPLLALPSGSGEKTVPTVTKKKTKKKIDVLKALIYGFIGGFLVVIIVLAIYFFPFGENTSTQSDVKPERKEASGGTSISPSPGSKPEVPFTTESTKISGGVIKFKPGNSSLSYDESVILSITEPLKSSNGETIDADIYYTLDDSEPTKENGEKYRIGEPLVFQETGSVTIKARAIAREVKYEGPVYFKDYIIDTGPIIGGEITFLKPGGNYIDSVEIPLSYKTLKFARGKAILGEIRYTLDGSDPTRTNGTQYKEGGHVKLPREGKYTLKAKVFSRDGKYEGQKVFSQTYAIQKKVEQSPQEKQSRKKLPVEVKKEEGEHEVPVQVQTKSEPQTTVKPETVTEVTDVDDLDQKNISDVLDRIKKIEIDLSGITYVSKTGILQIKISISSKGEARLVEILDFTAEPAEKFAEIKSALAKEIQDMKFPLLTRQGKPVNAELVVDFRKVAGLQGQYEFE